MGRRIFLGIDFNVHVSHDVKNDRYQMKNFFYQAEFKPKLRLSLERNAQALTSLTMESANLILQRNILIGFLIS